MFWEIHTDIWKLVFLDSAYQNHQPPWILDPLERPAPVEQKIPNQLANGIFP